MPSLTSLWILLLVTATGCRYQGPYVEGREEVRVTWAAAASTAVYRAEGAMGAFRFARYEGGAVTTIAGGTAWDLPPSSRHESSRSIAQPLSSATVELRQSKGGASLKIGKRTLGLEFVTGNWAEFVAGRDVVLKLGAAAWETWNTACQDAFLARLDEYPSARRRSVAEPTPADD